MSPESVLLDTCIPAAGFLRLQRLIAVAAVQLVKRGRLEALSKTRTQDGLAVIERPCRGKLPGCVPAIHVMMIVALSRGEGQPGENLAAQLCIAAIDGCLPEDGRRRHLIRRRIAVDRGALDSDTP